MRIGAVGLYSTCCWTLHLFLTDDFPYISFGKSADCLSKKCYICHWEVKEVVLFAKVEISALALLPFSFFY